MKSQFGIGNIYLGSGLSGHDRTVPDGNDGEEYLDFNELNFGDGRVTNTLHVLYKGIRKYSPSFYTNIKSKWYNPEEKTPLSILLGEDLKTKKTGLDTPLAGTNWVVWSGDWIVSLSTNSDIPIDQVFHHEFNHWLMMFADPADLNDISVNPWMKFPEINEKYNLKPYDDYGGITLDRISCELTMNTPQGFTSCLGTFGVTEDMADVARILMTGDSDSWKRAKTDVALAEKMDAMITVYEKFSGGEMNRTFFETLSNDPTINYWEWPDIDKGL